MYFFALISLTMSFSEAEGTAFCDILANNFNSWQVRLSGELIVNGVSVAPRRLADRVAYVRKNHNFSPDMSVRQTMLFHSFLREPGSHVRSRDTKGRVRISFIIHLAVHYPT